MSVLKRAVLIGINYTGTDNELNGCINDTENLKEFLLRNKYFKEDEMEFLNDNKKGTNLYPTKANIMSQLDNLVKFANDNKNSPVELFVSYSGHGYYQTDKNGDEKDGRDEVLCPIDSDESGFIVDDDLRERFVNKLGSNVKCVFLSDSCHSGTILDLRFTHTIGGFSNSVEENKKSLVTLCDIVCISGCKDSQTSADAYISDINGKMEYQGAMSCSFIKTFVDGISYKKLLTDMRKYLTKNRFTQIPLLSCGKKININDQMLLSQYN